MTIDALPALDRTSATFKTDLDSLFLTALPTFSVQAESARVAINASTATAEAARVTAQAAIDAGLANAATNAATATTKAGEANASAIAAAASAASVAGGPVSLAGAQTLTNKTIHGDANALTADGTNSVGFRHIPQVSQSAAYTLTLTNAGKHILHPSADTTARIFTIPANASVAFPIGAAITFVNQASAGVITIAIATDTMRLAGAGTTGSRTLAANGVATAIKLTATEWIINGAGLT